MADMDALLGAGFRGLDERGQLQRTAQELESVVVSQLFRTMRNTVPEGGLFEKSAAEDVFRTMLDDELARVVARQSPFGLAKAIVDRFEERLQEPEPSTETKGEPSPNGVRSWRT